VAAVTELAPYRSVAAGPATRSPWNTSVRVGLAVWLVTRAGFYLVGWVVTCLAPAARGKDVAHTGFRWPFQLYGSFDTGHYLRIATQGYFPRGPGAPSPSLSPAFFPGYPMTARFLARCFGLGQASIAGQFAALAALSLIASAVSAVLLHKLATELSGERIARTAVIVLLAGPYSVFLMASYSEGLFLALALASWLAGRRNAWLLAGSFGAAAALVRINGLFLAVALATMFLLAVRREPGSVRRHQGMSLLLPPAATLGYFGWLHQQTGRWSEWFDVERIGWGRTTNWPSTAFIHSTHRILASNGLAEHFQNCWEIVYAVGFVVATALLIGQRSWPEATYVGLTAASLLTSDRYLSVPRSALVCFPVVLLAAKHALRIPRGWPRYATVSAGLLLLAINTVCYLCGEWAG
jgi:hypothetical protein